MLQRCRTFRKMENSIFFSIFSGKFDIFVTKFYHLFVMLMNLIGFVIENLSYNWSIITYRNSNTNSVGVFHCIKIIYGTFHLEGTCDLEGLCFCWISLSHFIATTDLRSTTKGRFIIIINNYKKKKYR